jgi:hypothetical protein
MVLFRAQKMLIADVFMAAQKQTHPGGLSCACGHAVKTRRHLVTVFVVSKGVCSIAPSKPNMEQQITRGFRNAFHWTLFVHRV